MFRRQLPKYKCSQLTTKRLLSYNYDRLSLPSNFVLSKEVKEGLKNAEPIIALESTIISHGMPYPDNLSTALAVEKIVKDNGCIPCTIAIIDNKVYYGLSEELVAKVAKTGLKATKVSRRDIVNVLSKGGVGSTTVSGTLALASQINLKMMVTGGLGGVHKDGQNSLDISADLVELGKQPITVVCSGVKSILDIGLSLEVLETQGVAVVTFNPESKTFQQTQLGSGAVIAVPIPKLNDGNEQVDFEKVIDEAVELSIKDNIQGKDVTPYLLDKVKQLSNGKSLEANIGLVKNNALEVHKRTYTTTTTIKNSNIIKDEEFQPTVLGSSSIDVVSTLPQTNLNVNSSTPGQVYFTVGGVGLNLSLTLTKYNLKVKFISVVGNGPLAKEVVRFCKDKGLATDGILKIGEANQTISQDLTSIYNALHDNGNLNYAIFASPLLDTLTTDQLKIEPTDLKLLLIDANFPPSLLHHILKLKPKGSKDRFVIFEPTSTPKSTKIWDFITESSLEVEKDYLPDLITPNLYELTEMFNCLTTKLNVQKPNQTITSDIQIITDMALYLHKYIPYLIVKLGKLGCLVVSNNTVTLIKPDKIIDNPVNVSGAGDTLVGTVTTIIYRYLREGKSMQQFGHTNLITAVEVGMQAAQLTLMDQDTVGKGLNEKLLEKVKF